MVLISVFGQEDNFGRSVFSPPPPCFFETQPAPNLVKFFTWGDDTNLILKSSEMLVVVPVEGRCSPRLIFTIGHIPRVHGSIYLQGALSL